MAGASGGHSELMYGFGGLPRKTGESLYGSQLGPLLRGLGAGMGNNWDKFNARLQGAGGPLAEAIRGIQGLAPSVLPQATDIGNQIATQAPEQYELFKNQLAQSMQTGNQASDFLKSLQDPTTQGIASAQTNINTAQNNIGYANQALQDAFNPVNQSALYQQSVNRMMPELQAGLAARGMLESGAGGAAESDALRNLSFQYLQNQAGLQQNALGGANQALGGANQALSGLQGQLGTGINLGQAMSTTGQQNAQLAGAGMEGLGQLSNLLQQQYGIPMAAAGSLLSLLTAGLSPGINLTQATAPIGGQEQKSTSVL